MKGESKEKKIRNQKEKVQSKTPFSIFWPTARDNVGGWWGSWVGGTLLTPSNNRAGTNEKTYEKKKKRQWEDIT